VRGFLYGLEAHTFAASQEDIDVRVRVEQASRRSVYDLANTWIITPAGRAVPLPEVPRIDDSQTYATIHRVDRQRAVTVTAETAAWLSPEAVVHKLTTADGGSAQSPLAALRHRHPGVRFELTGRQEQIAEAFS